MEALRKISTPPRTDDELLAAYRLHRQQEVLAELFTRYQDLIYGVCVKYLKDQDAAQDAVMNIYEELVKKLHNHEVENFKSWVYVLAKNHCLMDLRKQKKMPTTEFQPEFMQSADFSHLDNALEKEERLNSLENCIEQLNEEQKLSIRLFYLESKCYNEIVEMTGLDWNKVRSLIQNGRRNLKICMES
ncbi:MAG: sigma-70 family polymerase sigma factor [Chitinophagaceae bacterium]|nr:sigma-70 family polymerase sigma factor [Chitinophagaceae bacterium]